MEVTRRQDPGAQRPETADGAQRRPRGPEMLAAAAQHVLLAGFAAVAAGISAQGLTGFARDNMGLTGPWPYLLFFALDGAAGVCAVLLLRRAARAEAALAPRLAVWGLVAASAAFNWAHAPHHPAARPAFALMPVIAATLFEFSLRETARQTRRAAAGPDRRLAGLAWLRPVERVRVHMQLAAASELSAEQATRRVRAGRAATRLHQLRQVLHASDQAAGPGSAITRRARRAERRARAALTRAGFADPGIAAEILRQVQVLTWTAALARLDYTTADAAHAAIGNLITPSPAEPPPQPQGTSMIHNGSRGLTHPSHLLHDGVTHDGRPPASAINGHPATLADLATWQPRPGVPSSVTRDGAGGDAGQPAIGPRTRRGRRRERDGALVEAASAHRRRSQGQRSAAEPGGAGGAGPGPRPRHRQQPPALARRRQRPGTRIRSRRERVPGSAAAALRPARRGERARPVGRPAQRQRGGA